MIFFCPLRFTHERGSLNSKNLHRIKLWFLFPFLFISIRFHFQSNFQPSNWKFIKFNYVGHICQFYLWIRCKFCESMDPFQNDKLQTEINSMSQWLLRDSKIKKCSTQIFLGLRSCIVFFCDSPKEWDNLVNLKESSIMATIQAETKLMCWNRHQKWSNHIFTGSKYQKQHMKIRLEYDDDTKKRKNEM